MGKPQILCVDDLEQNLVSRKMLLELFGCDVKLATDARQCMAAVRNGGIDLVLIDYHLGEVALTGEDLARDIRALQPQLRLVMLTGDPKIPESAYESVDAVFIKGADNPSDLINTIQRLLPDANLRKPRPHIYNNASSA